MKILNIILTTTFITSCWFTWKEEVITQNTSMDIKEESISILEVPNEQNNQNRNREYDTKSQAS